MDTRPELNAELYRELRNDYPEDIFPKVACKKTELGNGDTFFSVEKIAQTIDKYAFQCEKIAQKLKKKNEADTCKAIHSFLFHHFQYKADGTLQKLCSPACSWKQRKEGIDCKSYTILAGCILKVLGYAFYIRQVKQLASATPDQFSHVYIVVPKDQITNTLDTGYFVIDGTIPIPIELPYIIPADYFIMKHIGLNGSTFRNIASNKTYLPPPKIKKIACNCSKAHQVPLGNAVIPVNTPTFISPPPVTFNSQPTFGSGTTNTGNSGTNNDTSKGVKILGFVDKLLAMGLTAGDIVNKFNGKAGSEVIPASVQSQEQILQYFQQTSQQNQQMMMTLLAAMAGNGKPNYTPYIIGGVALVLVVVLMKDDKK